MLEHIIIGIIYDEPLTGYDIKKTIEETIGMIYHASFGSMYPLLKKLADRGLVQETSDSVKETNASKKTDGRIKKYYKSTEKGKEYFHSWLIEPTASFETFENLLSKVYFFSKLTKDERSGQFASFKQRIMQVRKKIAQMHASCLSKPEKEHDYYKSSILYFGQIYIDTLEKWCKTIDSEKTFTIE